MNSNSFPNFIALKFQSNLIFYNSSEAELLLQQSSFYKTILIQFFIEIPASSTAIVAFEFEASDHFRREIIFGHFDSKNMIKSATKITERVQNSVFNKVHFSKF